MTADPDKTPMGNPADEFFIGYLPHAPARTSRFATKVAALLVLLGVTVASLAAVAQHRYDAGFFEFGQVRGFNGLLRIEPVPMLRVETNEGGSQWLVLVGEGKHGIPQGLRSHDGDIVKLRGTIAQRRGVALLEVAAGSVETVSESPLAPVGAGRETFGTVSLVGELVDSKCFLGVMRPATGKVHRGCAVRCLSGGAPPALWIRGASPGEDAMVLLAPQQGVEIDPSMAGLAVQVTGTLEHDRDFGILRLTSAPQRYGGTAP